MTAVIKTKAYALIRRNHEILVEAIPDGKGVIIGYRPLGGSVEFGETASVAVAREFVEELNVVIQVTGLFNVAEEIFEYDGKPCHEVMFIYEAEFADKTLYEQDAIEAMDTEHNISVKAFWVNPNHMPDGIRLFPADMAAELRKNHGCCH